jgi:alcohol dehydrogenase
MCSCEGNRVKLADVFAIQGLYSATPKGSFIPGLEFSGEIIAVGFRCTEWRLETK